MREMEPMDALQIETDKQCPSSSLLSLADSVICRKGYDYAYGRSRENEETEETGLRVSQRLLGARSIISEYSIVRPYWAVPSFRTRSR